MQFETKLYKYDSTQEANGYRGEDYSKYILQGDTEVDDLTEILDVVTLTLDGVSFSKEFSPLTKFIYEKWEYRDALTNKVINYASPRDKTLVMWKDWHLCVAYDIVSQPVPSDNTIFVHQITFNEASVDAQKRIVDNIAVTYKLQDVTLETTPSYDVDGYTDPKYNHAEIDVTKDWNFTDNFVYAYFGHQFKWTITSDTDWNMKKYQVLEQGVTSKEIDIPIPILQCEFPSGKREFTEQGQCSRYVTIQSVSVINSQDIKEELSIRIDPLQLYAGNWVEDRSTGSILPTGYISSRIAYDSASTVYVKKVSEYGTSFSSDSIQLVIQPNRRYTVAVTLHDFQGGSLVGLNLPNYYQYDLSNRVACLYDGNNGGTPKINYTDTNRPLATMSFECVSEESSITINNRSASPYNAYDLYNKAMLTTQNYKKQEGIVIDETPKAYYLEAQDKERLSNTSIVENFYNQKNWWELQLDIGKYIHCIPKVRFGKDDRLVTTWQQLGSTNKKQDKSTQMSIFNSRQVDEYIASVSSYVSNLVQLGGIIDEWVAPKSSSADYLVYNDVAEIHTTRNIIEIVDVEVKRVSDGVVRNLVGKGANNEASNGYVFASEIYKTLPVSAQTIPNKGLAIWYNLGDNKIQGLNYRLPSTSNYDKADSEYAIKRVLGDAFYGNAYSEWKNIKVNDYLFHIVYRTKDTIRTNQIRPDLRKYLLTSKYDRVPQANQFNNQTDTVVDSVKFGNNTYGKLIRTGNTKYTVMEWHESLQTIKQAGELYDIRGEWFYVSKATNTYYANHITSEVEFSKDYNQLSQIIGIPSEPRFYEISEQSQIKREVTLDDYLVVGTDIVSLDNTDSYVNKNGWEWIRGVLFGETKDYPQYAITVFKNDSEKETILGNENFYKEFCHALGTYSIENTLTISWGMEDNFSAGTTTTITSATIGIESAVDGAYATTAQVKYTDIFGRSDLLEFAIINKYDVSNKTLVIGEGATKQTVTVVSQLPNNPIALSDIPNEYVFGSCNTSNVSSHTHGIGLLKDNREALHFNYNLQMITDSDRFVISSYIWQVGKTGLKLALLYDEVNKISNNTVQESGIMPTLYTLSSSIVDINSGCIQINVSSILASVDNATMDKVASIAVISNNNINDVSNSGAKYFVLARNVSDLSNDSKKADWYISHVDKRIFQQQ